MSDEYKDYDPSMQDMDFVENMTDEQLEQAVKAIAKAVDAITEAMVKFTEAFKESVTRIDWNAILEAMQEAQNYAGDNNNGDNMYNIGDDLMDQQREAEE